MVSMCYNWTWAKCLTKMFFWGWWDVSFPHLIIWYFPIVWDNLQSPPLRRGGIWRPNIRTPNHQLIPLPFMGFQSRDPTVYLVKISLCFVSCTWTPCVISTNANANLVKKMNHPMKALDSVTTLLQLQVWNCYPLEEKKTISGGVHNIVDTLFCVSTNKIWMYCQRAFGIRTLFARIISPSLSLMSIRQRLKRLPLAACLCSVSLYGGSSSWFSNFSRVLAVTDLHFHNSGAWHQARLIQTPRWKYTRTHISSHFIYIAFLKEGCFKKESDTLATSCKCVHCLLLLQISLKKMWNWISVNFI